MLRAAGFVGLVGLVGCVTVEPARPRASHPNRNTSSNTASGAPTQPTQTGPIAATGAECAGAAGLDSQVCGDWHKGALGLNLSAATHSYSWSSGTEQVAQRQYEVCGPDQRVPQPVLVLLDVAGGTSAACFHYDVKPTHDGGRIMRMEQVANCCELLRGTGCTAFGATACEQRLRAAPAELHGDFSRR